MSISSLQKTIMPYYINDVRKTDLCQRLSKTVSREWVRNSLSRLPSVDNLVDRIVQLGRFRKVFKVDLSRAYCQKRICVKHTEKRSTYSLHVFSSGILIIKVRGSNQNGVIKSTTSARSFVIVIGPTAKSTS